MKTRIVAIVLLAVLVTVGGCEEIMLLGGAAGGITLDRMLGQAQEDVEENITLLEDQNKELQIKLEQATDDSERDSIREDVEANLATIEKLVATKATIEGTRAGLGTDWTNPESITLFGTTALGLYLAYLQRKKKNQALAAGNTKQKALEEVVAGGQEFKARLVAKATAGGPAEVLTAFKESQGEKQSPETKKMVAVIRAS